MTLIAFVDDHPRLRNHSAAFLKKAIPGCVVHEYNNGLEFSTSFPKEGYTPDIVLMDIRMSPMNGYETTSWLQENYTTIPVLAFSDVIDKEAIVEISFCGAKGCTEKSSRTIDLLPQTIERIVNGETHYDTVEVHKLVKQQLRLGKKNINEGFSSLTRKEVEILKLAGDEQSAKEKASWLCISPATFCKHISKIYQKMNIRKAAALGRLAHRLGLTDK